MNQKLNFCYKPFIFKYRKYYKLLFLLCSNLIILIIIFFGKLQFKIALCTLGKKENLYVKEFVLYYKKLGIDKIFIYDDNDINTEKINDVNPLKHYARVYRNKNKIKNHSDAFTHCYNNNKNKYNWILMIDMDEFLTVVNDTLKSYLSSPIFNRCDFIIFHWLIPSDNNLIYYDNRSLFERFKGPYVKSRFIKTIIRGGIPKLKYHCHSPSFSPINNITCNNEGKIIKYKRLDMKKYPLINTKKAYIIHFKFKSTEEYFNKFKRGYSNWHKNRKQHLYNKLYQYLRFKYNNITKEKLNYIENKTNINLSKYYKRIK